jgi:K+-transporting ATPase KdpF subunit
MSVSPSSASWPCGASRPLVIAHRRPAMFDYVISGIVSVFLLVYLGWAMFKPEKF